MFLFWNYTIEAFFWILLGAIALISLTIFFASPKQKSKPLPVLEKRDGKIIEVDQYAKKESNLNFDSEKSRLISEDEKFEAFVETLPKSVQAIVGIRAYIGIFYGLLILALGFAALEIQRPITNALFSGFIAFLASIFGSMAFIYGLIQNSHFTTKWGARLMTIFLFFSRNSIAGFDTQMSMVWFTLIAISVLYSINFTQLIGFTGSIENDYSNIVGNLGVGGGFYRFLLFLLLLIFFLMTRYFINSFV